MLELHNKLNTEHEGPIWSWFDADLYSGYDALAAGAAREGNAAALTDYEQRGSALAYAPNMVFDPVYYLARYPDVAIAIKNGHVGSAFEHYASGGWQNRNPHWLFNVEQYRALNSDLTAEVVAADGGLYGHYLRCGSMEGRTGHDLFQPAFYIAQVPENERAMASRAPFQHFLKALHTHATEGRCSPYFDPSWYLATYPQSAVDVAAGNHSCALHYHLDRGIAAGNDPLCDFSEAEYRQRYPDVDDAVRNNQFVNAYEHFIKFGVFDFRSPAAAIDLAWYSRLPSVEKDMASGRFRDVFAHLIQVGLDIGLPLHQPVSRYFSLREEESRQAFISQAQRSLSTYGRRPLDFTSAGNPELAVIVVVWNRFPLTMQCLSSLRMVYQGNIQLIIVDNCSIDGTTDISDLVMGATVIRLEKNVGFLKACNIGLQHATAPAILYLNNDVILHSGSVQTALDRLWSEPTIGAVGGKIIRTHGLLQEAGCILWRDGGTEGWMRDQPPDVPEANFVRDVDFCSGCFLLVRGDLLHELGGFDEAFAPAYYEETDLCLRIQQAGSRVVYDPMISLTHLEYASSRSVRAATSQISVNRAVLRARHAMTLRRRSANRVNKAEAAAFASRGRRVLFLEDTIPLHRLGSGYGRAADVLSTLVAAGWQGTVFPMVPVTTPGYRLSGALPDTVEVLWDRDKTMLKAFLLERRGYYDLVWVSRAHNLRQLVEIVGEASDILGEARVILDTEAVFSVRDACRAKLDGVPFDMKRALRRELEQSWNCDHIVAVNASEANVIATFTGRSVGIVGSRQEPRPLANPYGRRQGLLHVGALTSDLSPNYDGLRWYMTFVHPIVARILGPEAARLTIAGHTDGGADLTWLASLPSVDLLGPVTNLVPLYERHRVFIAPTRFAAGIPVKVLEAAAFGIPVACTSLLAGQLGWESNGAVVHAPETDPELFAKAVIELYRDSAVWEQVRSDALTVIEADMSPARFADQLAAAVNTTGLSMPFSRSRAKPALVDPAKAKPAPPIAENANSKPVTKRLKA